MENVAFLGSDKAKPEIATTSINWEVISQLLLRPRTLVKNGIRAPSIRGAHSGFKAYGKPTKENKPIVERSISASRSQALKVPNDNSSGRPLTKPRIKTNRSRF
jgi:hypothetical protein